MPSSPEVCTCGHEETMHMLGERRGRFVRLMCAECGCTWFTTASATPEQTPPAFGPSKNPCPRCGNALDLHPIMWEGKRCESAPAPSVPPSGALLQRLRRGLTEPRGTEFFDGTLLREALDYITALAPPSVPPSGETEVLLDFCADVTAICESHGYDGFKMAPLTDWLDNALAARSAPAGEPDALREALTAPGGCGYTPAGVLIHLAEQHIKSMQHPSEQPVYGPRAAFVIETEKGLAALRAALAAAPTPTEDRPDAK